jgi:hypothetical protein
VWLADCVLIQTKAQRGEDVLVLEIPEHVVKPFE